MECPKEIRAAWRACPPFGSEGASAFVPDSEAFNSFVGDGFLIPELKGGSEASEDDPADNVSNEALYVIGLHGSDWEVAKVALSCHTALDMLCQEYTKLNGDVAGLASERACRLSDTPL